MHQVLFRIPIHTSYTPDGIPIYGYGFMLFVTFIACTWLAGRRAEKEGIAREHVQDLALWLFVGGLIGSRVVFMIQFGVPWSQFINIWDGGLVFYGGLFGGAIAYALAHHFVLRRHGIGTLQMADVIAPCAALGLCLGRVGCLLNGCCYGEVACPNCPEIRFPLSGMPTPDLVYKGYQTAAGFTLADVAENDRTVGVVEPGSAAEAAGLQPGDVIVAVDGQEVANEHDLGDALVAAHPRGKNDVILTVKRDDQELTIGPFRPRGIGLHPTQLYETISMALLIVLLIAYYPYRRHSGELFALFLLLYPIHRFLNEMLRSDNRPIAFGLTLSQNGSILVAAVGLVFLLWLRRLPPRTRPTTAPKLA